jgi:hypothetical protein
MDQSKNVTSTEEVSSSDTRQTTTKRCDVAKSQFPTYDQLLRAFFPPLGASEGVRAECRAAWKDYCYDHDYPVYECWNREYIDQLALYLIERKRHLASAGEMEVLEAGAGTGKLTYGLQQAFKRMVHGDL